MSIRWHSCAIIAMFIHSAERTQLRSDSQFACFMEHGGRALRVGPESPPFL